MSDVNMSVWLKREHTKTRANFCAAVDSYPLPAVAFLSSSAARARCDEYLIVMVDMRKRKYVEFLPRAERAEGSGHTFEESIARCSHVLLEKVDIGEQP